MLLLLLGTAHATWSLVAVAPETQEVGAAGATCGPMVWYIAGLAPGRGAVAAQYATWLKARREATDLLEQGEAPEAVLAAVLDMDDEPAIRQYAVVSLDAPPATWTGAEVEEPALIVSGETWSVQGNTLASDDVVTRAAAAFEATEGEPLADRLLAGLEAGAAAGGDSRCEPEDAAKSAFLYVAAAEDRRREPTVEVRASGKGAVAELALRYAAGRGSCASAGRAPSWLGAVLALLALLRRRGR